MRDLCSVTQRKAVTKNSNIKEIFNNWYINIVEKSSGIPPNAKGKAYNISKVLTELKQ